MNILKKPVVAIIDYDMGNLFSVQHACNYVGLEPVVTFDKQHILNADAAILPGVGAFGDAIVHLEKLDLVNVILDFIQSGKPLMGICLGMQLLFSMSEEFGKHKGLGVIEGEILKIPKENLGEIRRIPQIQWNTIYNKKKDTEWSNPILHDIKQNEYMYFIHSFYAKPENSLNILTLTDYDGFEYCSGVQKENVVAFQFHPEKSATEGVKIFKNFKKILINEESVYGT